ILRVLRDRGPRLSPAGRDGRRDGGAVRGSHRPRAPDADAALWRRHRTEGRVRAHRHLRPRVLPAQHRGHRVRPVSVEAALVHPGHSAHRERHRDQRSPGGRRGRPRSHRCAALLHETDDLGAGARCGQPVTGCRRDRRHQRPAVQLDRLRHRRRPGRRRRRAGRADLFAGARHGRAPEHPRVRDRDPRRHGLRGRQHHRGARPRRGREPLHGVLPGSDARLRVHERVRRARTDGRADRPAAGSVRPSPSENGVIHVRWLPASLMLAAAVLALACVGRLNAYWMHVAIIAMYYAILASSWSLLAGYVGLFSLSHMAFASIGGYTSGLLTQWLRVPIPFGMLAGVIVCCAVGGAIGWGCLRMSGPYLAIFTLGVSEIGRLTIEAAAACGVAVERCRIVAFAIASGFAGLAGGFYAHYIGIMTPSVGDLDEMAKLVVMTVIGGMERLPTAVGGAFVVQFLLEWLREYGQWRLPGFGIVLLLTMRLARNGLLTPLWLPFLRVGGARGGPLVAAPAVPAKEPRTGAGAPSSGEAAVSSSGSAASWRKTPWISSSPRVTSSG